MPFSYKILLYIIFIVQFFVALLESITIFVLALFSVSIAAPDMAINNVFIRFLIDIFPSLEIYCTEQKNLVLMSSILVISFIILKNICMIGGLSLNRLLSENISVFIGHEILHKYLNNIYYWHLSSENHDMISKFFFRP
jgi:hypothetical protein